MKAVKAAARSMTDPNRQYADVKAYGICVRDRNQPNTLNDITAFTWAETPEAAIRRCRRLWKDTRLEQLIALPAEHEICQKLCDNLGTTVATELNRFVRLEADQQTYIMFKRNRSRQRLESKRVKVVKIPDLPVAAEPLPVPEEKLTDPFVVTRKHKVRKPLPIVKPGVNDRTSKVEFNAAAAFAALRAEFEAFKAGKSVVDRVAPRKRGRPKKERV